VRVRVGGGGDSVDILMFRAVGFMSGDISDIGYYLMVNYRSTHLWDIYTAWQ
jgi:hypothetical protein